MGKAGDAELPQAETRRKHFDRLVEIGGAQSGCCHLQKYVPTRQSRIEPRQWRFRQNRCMIFLSDDPRTGRSEEHTSELQSLMRISYAVFCLKKKNTTQTHTSMIKTSIHTTIHQTSYTPPL